MKKRVIALLIILGFTIYGCGKENTSTSIQREDYSYNVVSPKERVEKYLFEAVPEISDYATYIEQESDGQARLYIRVSEKEEVVDAEIYSLEDWRNGDGYQTEIGKEKEILEKYTKLVEEENAERMAFVYFDEDDIPELVMIKDGKLSLELKAASKDYGWHTYDAEKEIGNENFLEKLSGLGYDKLIPCGYLYGDIEDAYRNIARVSDTSQIWNEFVTGKRDAVECVELIGDIPEEGFVTRSFDEIYKDITCEENWWGKKNILILITMDRTSWFCTDMQAQESFLT